MVAAASSAGSGAPVAVLPPGATPHGVCTSNPAAPPNTSSGLLLRAAARRLQRLRARQWGITLLVGCLAAVMSFSINLAVELLEKGRFMLLLHFVQPGGEHASSRGQRRQRRLRLSCWSHRLRHPLVRSRRRPRGALAGLGG